MQKPTRWAFFENKGTIMTSPDLKAKIDALKGTRIQHVHFSFSASGFAKKFNEVSVGNAKSGVSPGPNCDIIINDSSTRSDRVYSINPNVIEDKTTLFAINPKTVPTIDFFAFCDIDDVELLYSQFILKSKVLLDNHAKLLAGVIKDIEKLTK